MILRNTFVTLAEGGGWGYGIIQRQTGQCVHLDKVLVTTARPPFTCYTANLQAYTLSMCPYLKAHMETEEGFAETVQATRSFCYYCYFYYYICYHLYAGYLQLFADLLPSFPCKLNTFRKRVKNVITSKGNWSGD